MATIGYKIGRFQFQGGTKKELEASELILLENELALEVDEETGSVKMRRGDGKSKYADCPYIDIGTITVADLTEEDIEKITGPRGEPGKDFTYDMFTPEQRLDLKGEPGKDGKSITIKSQSLNSTGDRVVVFSDNTSVTIPKGDKGAPGSPGKDGSDATVVAGTGLSKSGSTISVNTSYVATKSDLNVYAKTVDIPKLVTLTQAQYDALSTKDSNTYYFIKE